MKGQGNAILYGDKLCSLRQSGDIDIYLEGGYKKVIDFDFIGNIVVPCRYYQIINNVR